MVFLELSSKDTGLLGNPVQGHSDILRRASIEECQLKEKRVEPLILGVQKGKIPRKYGPSNGGERCIPEVSERKRSENWIFVGYRELTEKY